ncbi:hypothetical protein L0F63_003104 [Massospora cicadina]|nr:hypothetical protein L0F63_003104 [Massospora cicadina]
MVGPDIFLQGVGTDPTPRPTSEPVPTVDDALFSHPGYVNRVHRDLNRTILAALKPIDLKLCFDQKGNPPVLASEVCFDAVALAKVPPGIERLSKDPALVPKGFLLPYIDLACYFHLNVVYLWSYRADKLFYFDTPSGNILAVGLVKPRAGVFPAAKFLLVIATPSKVEFFPLDIGEDETITLYSTGHQTSSDGHHITRIIGCENGRIFMGTRNGDILELKYQLTDGVLPFSKKMSITNCTRSFFAPLTALWPNSPTKAIVTLKVDEERRILYSLSFDSTIQIINLGKDGDCFGLIGNVDLGMPMAQKQLGLGDAATLTPIVDLHVIPLTDSSVLRLVAIAASGISLYYRSAKQSNPDRATGVVLDFARPSTHASFTLDGYRGMVSIYTRGVLLAATPSGPDSSILSVTFVEGAPTTDSLAVQARTLNFGGLLMDAKEQDLTSQNYFTKATEGLLPNFDDVVSQYYSPTRMFNLMTKEGVIQLVKLRPVDQLSKALLGEVPSASSLADIVRRVGPSECCGMILLLLSEYPLAIVEGDPTVVPSPLGKPYLAQGIKDRLIRAYTELGGSPRVHNNLGHRSVIYSNGFTGALLSASRVLAPLWNARIFNLRTHADKSTTYDLLLNPPTLQFAKAALDNLLAAYDLIPVLSNGPPPGNGGEDEATDAVTAERRSLHSLKSLVALSSQALGFVLAKLTWQIGAPLMAQLMDSTLEFLVTSPSRLDIIHELAKRMMDQPQQSNLPSIHDFLKHRCKDLCNPDQLPMLKGFELLKEAKGLPKAKMLLSLKSAQNLFMNLSHALPLSQLTDILRQYQELGFQLGSLDLIAANAAKLPPHAPEAENYYAIVSVPLDSVRRVLHSNPLVGPGMRSLFLLTVEEHADLQRGLRLLLENVHDPHFHKAVYDWFLANRLPMLLYEICSPFFLDYLEGSSIADKRNARCCYFVSKGMYCAAARYLFQCATAEDDEALTLQKRIELLHQAKGYTENINASDSSPNFFQLAKEIKANLQAALIQLNLIDEYRECYPESLECEPQVSLNAKLFPVHELYFDFACRFNLAKSKRLIVSKEPLINCSNLGQ